ncbi:MAG: flagellar export protein FliJ [Rhodospirillaceae bacterium]|nr:flagellar export protein FliJ [Rhodospirillaceae bacterium]
MAGGLKTLIRLNQWGIDQKRRKLGAILRLIAALEQQGLRLEEELISEQAAAAASPEEAGFLYGNYADHVIARRERIGQSIAHADKEADEARDELTQAYRELKKYETAQADRDKRQEIEELRLEQAELDEIGIKAFTRNKAEINSA